MKQEHNQLDDFLHNQVENAHFDFKEAYWDKMEVLLDEEQKEKKKPLFWRGLSIFVVALIVSAGAYILPKLKQAEATNSAPTIVQSQAVEPVNTDQNIVSQNDTNVTPNTSSTSQESTSITPSNQSNTTSKSKSKSKSKSTQASNDIAPSQDGQTLSNANQATPTPSSTDVSASSTKQTKATAKQQSINADTKSTVPQLSKKEQKRADALARKEAKNQAKEEQQRQDQAKADLLNAQANLKKQDRNIAKKIEGMMPVDTIRYRQTAQQNSEKYNPRYIASLKDYVPEQYDSVTVITYTQAPKQVENNVPNATPNQDTNAKKKIALSFFLMGGMNINKGINGNTATSMPMGVSPFLNAGIEKQIHKKISISAQVGFTYFNALNLETKVTSYRYSFGVDSNVFAVNYKKLLQFYLPVSVRYQLTQQHSILASLGMAYATDVSSLVKEHQSANSYQSFGYSSALNMMDVFAQLGYQYQVNPKLSATVLLQQGFMDISKNSFFNNTTQHSQSKMSLGLKYNFKRNGKK
jgi:hypothetical protein